MLLILPVWWPQKLFFRLLVFRLIPLHCKDWTRFFQLHKCLVEFRLPRCALEMQEQKNQGASR